MKFKLLLILILAFALTACGANPSADQPIPTVVLGNGNADNSATPQPAPQSSGGGVAASGIVIPAQDAQLAFALAGSVLKVHVAAGDQVQSGDVLAELDNAAIHMEVDQAQRTLRELTSPAAIAAAEQAIVNAQKAVDDAQKKVTSYSYKRAGQDSIDYYEAQLVLAQKALDQAKNAFNNVTELSPADPVRATATTNVYKAQQAYNTALANLNWVKGKPAESDIALANANLDAANAALQEAKWYLAELKGESIPADATGPKLAQLQQARDAFQAAQDKLARTRLLAPFDGTITLVNISAGEYVLPGQVLVSLSDVASLKVETTDLSERDVPRVSVGQNVTVSVKALNEDATGHVLSIAPVADTLGGDVVYKTIIALDTIPEGLRAGMTVTVQYEP